MRRLALWGLLGLSAAYLSVTGLGCAGSAPGGNAALASGDYARAIEELREAEALHPDDPAIERDLGIGLLQSGDPNGALPVLEKARALDPSDARALYFLARSADAAGRLDAALEAYAAYLGRSNQGASDVRARIESLTLQKATLEVEDAIASEQKLTLREVPQNSIAVPDFANVASSDTLAPLARGLAQMVITDLNRVRALRVVERQRLNVLLDEIGMGEPAKEQSSGGWPSLLTTAGLKARLAALKADGTGEPYYTGKVDENKDEALTRAIKAFQGDHGLTADGKVGPKTRAALEDEIAAVPEPAGTHEVVRGGLAPSTAPRAGLLLGARRFLQGSFAPVGADEIQLDAALLETSGGEVKQTGGPVRGEVSEVLTLEKGLVRQTLESLGITPTPEEWREIEKLPTENFLAFLAYSQGLWEEDLGNIPAARAAYQRAARLDPGFVDAKLRAEITGSADKDLRSLDQAQLDEGGAGGDDLTDRLLRTGSFSGLGPGPEVDRDGKDDPSVTGPVIGAVGGGDATIIIEGDLPTGGRP